MPKIIAIIESLLYNRQLKKGTDSIWYLFVNWKSQLLTYSLLIFSFTGFICLLCNDTSRTEICYCILNVQMLVLHCCKIHLKNIYHKIYKKTQILENGFIYQNYDCIVVNRNKHRPAITMSLRILSSICLQRPFTLIKLTLTTRVCYILLWPVVTIFLKSQRVICGWMPKLFVVAKGQIHLKSVKWSLDYIMHTLWIFPGDIFDLYIDLWSKLVIILYFLEKHKCIIE